MRVCLYRQMDLIIVVKKTAECRFGTGSILWPLQHSPKTYAVTLLNTENVTLRLVACYNGKIGPITHIPVPFLSFQQKGLVTSKSHTRALNVCLALGWFSREKTVGTASMLLTRHIPPHSQSYVTHFEKYRNTRLFLHTPTPPPIPHKHTPSCWVSLCVGIASSREIQSKSNYIHFRCYETNENHNNKHSNWSEKMDSGNTL